jgi:hypothetical protein
LDAVNCVTEAWGLREKFKFRFQDFRKCKISVHIFAFAFETGVKTAPEG